MPNDLTHPAPEQLAAYLAGESGTLDRAGIAAHLAGCQACAAEAEAIEAVTGELASLASLGEPEPPPGYHDRLVAAVQAELDQPAVDDAPAPVADLAARRRPKGIGNRPLAWGAVAAAALLVAVVSVTQLSDKAAEQAKDSGAAAAPAPRQSAGGATALSSAPGGIPVFRLAGELDPASLRSAVASSPQLAAAYQFAASEARGPRASDRSQPEAASAQSGAPPGLASCLAAAGPGATPAFFVEGTYQGRPATILVTVQAGGQFGLYVFGRGDCTTLIDSQRTSAPPTSQP